MEVVAIFIASATLRPMDLPGSSPGRTPLGHLRAFLRFYRPDVATVALYAGCVGVLSLVTPIVVQSVVTTVAFGTVLQPLVVLVMLLLAGLLVSAVLQALKAWVVEVLQRRFFVDVVSKLAQRLPRVDWEAARAAGGQHAVHRFFDLFMVHKTAASLLLGAIDILLAGGFGMVVLAFYHPVLLAFDVALLSTGAFIVFVLGRGGVPTAVDESSVKYEMGSFLAEIGRPGYAIKDAGGSSYAHERLDTLSADYLRARAAHFRVVLRQLLGALLTHAIASVALLTIGGWLVIRRELTVGQLVAAELIVTAVVASLTYLSRYVESYYDLATSLYKLQGLLELPTEAEGEETAVDEVRGPAELVLRDVEASVAGRTILDRVSLRIEPGTKLALVGAESERQEHPHRLAARLAKAPAGPADLGRYRHSRVVSRGPSRAGGRGAQCGDLPGHGARKRSARQAPGHACPRPRHARGARAFLRARPAAAGARHHARPLGGPPV